MPASNSPLSAGVCAPASKPACAVSAPTASTCSTCTSPTVPTSLHETLTTVAELVAEGKIVALGVSNFAAWQIGEVNHVADQVGAPRPVVAQQLYNLWPAASRRSTSSSPRSPASTTMVYNPLGGGLLTGRHTFEEAPDEGRFGDSRLAAMYRERYWDAQLFDAIGALSAIASEPGSPWPNWRCAGWCRKPATSVDAAGRIESGTAAVEHRRRRPRDRCPPTSSTACDDVGAALRGPMPAYNR